MVRTVKISLYQNNMRENLANDLEENNFHTHVNASVPKQSPEPTRDMSPIAIAFVELMSSWKCYVYNALL